MIENTEYLLKVAQAEADYQNALAGKSAMHTTINTTQSNIYVTEAAIEEQRVRLQNAETDYKRYAELMKEEAVTPQQFDRVKPTMLPRKPATSSCCVRKNHLSLSNRNKPNVWSRTNRTLSWQKLL